MTDCPCNALVCVGDHMECIDCGKHHPLVEPVRITKKTCTHARAGRLTPNDPQDTRRWCPQCKIIIP